MDGTGEAVSTFDGGTSPAALILASLRLTVACCLSSVLLLSVLQVGEGPYPSLWEPQAALDVEEAVRRRFLCRM